MFKLIVVILLFSDTVNGVANSNSQRIWGVYSKADCETLQRELSGTKTFNALKGRYNTHTEVTKAFCVPQAEK